MSTSSMIAGDIAAWLPMTRVDPVLLRVRPMAVLLFFAVLGSVAGGVAAVLLLLSLGLSLRTFL